MKIYVASDHAGFAVKEKVRKILTEEGYGVEDCGAYTLDMQDDYPDFVGKAAQKVSENLDDRALLFAGSGQAEMMLANKYPGVRAALFYTPKMATQAIDVKGTVSTDPYEILKLTRIHNNANVLSLGVRFLTEAEILHAIAVWLTTEFTKEARHVRRLKKIEAIERKERYE